MKVLRGLLIVLAGTVFANASVVLAQSPVSVPAAVQLATFSKVWSLDRSFPRKARAKVLIVYEKQHPESLDARDDVIRAARKFPDFDLRHVDLDETPLGPEQLAGIDYVYVAPLRAPTLRQVLETLRGARVRSVTAVPEYVRDGVSVGVMVAAGRPRLVINLAASRAQGSDFSSQLLKLARVIR